MVSQTVTFQCDEALQMKAVAILIQKASAFKSSIYLTRSGRRANAKSLLGVMSLGIPTQSEITVSCEGEDEDVAVKTIEDVLRAQKVIA